MSLKINVLHIVPALNQGGGIQQIVGKLCASQANASYRAEVLYLRGNNDSEYLFDNNVEVTKLNIINRAGMPRLLALRRLLIKKDADIIHVHSPVAGAVGRLCSWRTGAAIITTNHNNQFPLIYRIADYLTLAISDVVVGVSKAVTRYNWEKADRAWGRPPEFLTIYNGVSLTKFSPDTAASLGKINLRKQWRVPVDAFVVGFAGRLTRQKGWEILLGAIARLKNDGEECFCVFAGISAGIDKFWKEVNRLGISDRVEHIGMQTEIQNFYYMVDVCVFPSRWEGFGLAPVEAMAMGSAVVVADLDVFREVIGEGGRLVTNDVDAYSGAIKELKDSPSQRAKLGEAGKRRASALSEERMAASYDELYRRISSERSR